MKNYYQILDVPENATDDRIRKAYRSLALKFHPDRNPGDPSAEERFKEIAEAYGVLIDPAKRAQFEQWRSSGTREQMSDRGFRFTQEEILRDLFKDPAFSRIFQELFREFDKAGFRFDERFFNQTFFGGKGMLFGGVFVWGPFGSGQRHIHKPGHRIQVEKSFPLQLKPFNFLKHLGQKISGYLLRSPKALPHVEEKKNTHLQDLNYDLILSPDIARKGTWVKIAVDKDEGKETLKIKIPPNTRHKTRLRLKGKGMRANDSSGDLYITVYLK